MPFVEGSGDVTGSQVPSFARSQRATEIGGPNTVIVVEHDFR